MIKHALLVTAILAAAPTAAFAQLDDNGGGGGGAAPVVATPTGPVGEQIAPSGSGPAIFHKGTWGLSFGFPAGGISPFGEPVYGAGLTVPLVPQINLQYFLDEKTAIDLLFGIGVNDPDGAPATFGIAIGAGYRMYKHNSARIHTFMEPQLMIEDLDLNNNGGSSFGISVAGMVGVEAMLTDWFSLRGQVGLALSFTDKFNTINFSTGTSGLYANFYWE